MVVCHLGLLFLLQAQDSETGRSLVQGIPTVCVSLIVIRGHNNPLHLQLVGTRVGTLIVATIYLQLIQNRYMSRSFTVLQCSHQHCVQPVASDVGVVGYL